MWRRQYFYHWAEDSTVATATFTLASLLSWEKQHKGDGICSSSFNVIFELVLL
jgi:hypothetical protein